MAPHLQHLVGFGLTAIVAGQSRDAIVIPPSNGTNETNYTNCPEPVKTQLMNGDLWSLTVEWDDYRGTATFEAVGQYMNISGEWPGLRDARNYSVYVKTFHRGGTPCRTSDDCPYLGNARCRQACVQCDEGDACQSPTICRPPRPCVDETSLWMHPTDFNASCPPDHRDMICRDIREDVWVPLRCEVFEEDYIRPGQLMEAMNCKSVLLRYQDCLMQFAHDHMEYYFFRLSEVRDIWHALEAYIAAESGGPNHTYPGPNHTYPEPNYTYPGPNHTYPEPNYTYPGPNHTYPEPNYTYPGPFPNVTHPNVTDMCPEPVRSMLRRGQLWGLDIHDENCADGHHNAFNGANGLGKRVHGQWEGSCGDRPDMRSLRIEVDFDGIGDECNTQSDCDHIPCPTTCSWMSASDSSDSGMRCLPAAWGSGMCRNETYAMITVDEFRRACPADPRDEKCMYIKSMYWDHTGCEVFEHDDHMPYPPPSREMASTCLYALDMYESCIYSEFMYSDWGYYTFRKVPQDFYEKVQGYANGTLPGDPGRHCTRITKRKAEAVNAIPCGTPPGAQPPYNPYPTTHYPPYYPTSQYPPYYPTSQPYYPTSQYPTSYHPYYPTTQYPVYPYATTSPGGRR